MLSSVALRAGELLAAALLAGGVLLAVAAAAVWWLRRRIRRRLQVLGLALAARALGAAAGAASGGGRWAWSLPAPGRRWIAAGRARRKLRRAVGAAGHVVAVARKAGAPTRDLDALCRRLRQAAADADRSLAMAGRATGPGHQPEPVCTQVTDLVLAAGAIQDVAALAVASMSGPAVRGLADDARREALALSAGIASASRGAAGGLPGEPA